LVDNKVSLVADFDDLGMDSRDIEALYYKIKGFLGKYANTLPGEDITYRNATAHSRQTIKTVTIHLVGTDATATLEYKFTENHQIDLLQLTIAP
jgi:hypothetical protein